MARLRDAGYAVGPGALHRIASLPALRITISPQEPRDVEPLVDAVLAVTDRSSPILSR